MTGPVRRMAGLAALVVVAGSSLPTTAAASGTVVFQAMTTAVGLSVSSTQRPAASVVTGGLVDLTAGYATSALSSAGAAASAAAPVYPGDLVATGPALLCSEFLPCPVTPPAYPLLAQASWPDRPTGRADSPGPVGAASASAREQLTEGAAQVSTVTVPGAPVPVSVGAQRATTRTWADAAGAHVRATSTLTDVAVGPLHLASITASDVVDVSPAGRVSDRPGLTMAGVTFDGQSARVDHDGVHLLGVSQPLPDSRLAAQGVEIRAIDTNRSDRPGAARSTAGGLQVTFSTPVSGVPAVVPGVPGPNRTYLGSLMLGGVGIAAAAGADGGVLLAALPPVSPGSLDARLLPGPVAGPIGQGTSVEAGAAIPAIAPTGARRRLPLPQPDLTLVALLLAVVPPTLLAGWRLVVATRRVTR